MSGHSKWATTKHKKAAVDARRGKLFAKLIKNVEVAARTGGSDPAGNPTLYDAVQKAKKNSVPNENIDRAIRRGSGAEGGGAAWEAITYEGYAPGGVAVLVECLTDNRNRAAADVRTALTRNGGSMADPGSVSYMFHRKGVVIVAKSGTVTEDDVLAAVLDAGAEDVEDIGESIEVTSEPGDLVAVRTAVTDAGLEYDSAEVAFLPAVEVPLDEDQAKRVFRLIEALEDSDDVQDVYANYSVSDEVIGEARLAVPRRGGRRGLAAGERPPGSPHGLRPRSFVTGPWPCWPGGATPRNPPMACGPVPSSRGLGPAGPGERPPGTPRWQARHAGVLTGGRSAWAVGSVPNTCS